MQVVGIAAFRKKIYIIEIQVYFQIPMKATKNEKIIKNTTSEIVIEKIFDWFKTGRLKIGDRLPPFQDLAKTFDVGLSSIREALRVLGVMGYLDIQPGRGTFVRKDLSNEEVSTSGLIKVLETTKIFSIMEVRDWIECNCAKSAALRAGSGQIKKMESAIKIMENPHSSLDDVSKADLKFHMTVAEASNNDIAYEVMKLLIAKVEDYADKFWATMPKTREKAISTARQVLNHVKQRNGSKAAQSMHDHLELVREKLQEVLSESYGGRKSPN